MQNDVPSDVLRNAYQAFFLKSPAGQYFMQQLTSMRTNKHDRAEDSTDNATMYMYMARGIREVKEHIDSVTLERGAAK